MRDTRIPTDWQDQRRTLGFVWTAPTAGHRSASRSRSASAHLTRSKTGASLP